jgi:hypothetical protein
MRKIAGEEMAPLLLELLAQEAEVGAARDLEADGVGQRPFGAIFVDAPGDDARRRGTAPRSGR